MFSPLEQIWDPSLRLQENPHQVKKEPLSHCSAVRPQSRAPQIRQKDSPKRLGLPTKASLDPGHAYGCVCVCFRVPICWWFQKGNQKGGRPFCGFPENKHTHIKIYQDLSHLVIGSGGGLSRRVFHPTAGQQEYTYMWVFVAANHFGTTTILLVVCIYSLGGLL